MKIKHSLVVPCYNEEGNIENFLNEAKAAMVGYTDSFEIIFINDGSNDGTEKILKKISLYKEEKIKSQTYYFDNRIIITAVCIRHTMYEFMKDFL